LPKRELEVSKLKRDMVADELMFVDCGNGLWTHNMGREAT
jgi:hypothetical protein